MKQLDDERKKKEDTAKMLLPCLFLKTFGSSSFRRCFVVFQNKGRLLSSSRP